MIPFRKTLAWIVGVAFTAVLALTLPASAEDPPPTTVPPTTEPPTTTPPLETCTVEFLGATYPGTPSDEDTCVPDDDLNCEDFDSTNIDVTSGDPFGLDSDGDGVACEEDAPAPVPVAAPAVPVDVQPQFTG